MPTEREDRTAAILFRVLRGLADDPAVQRLKVRISELGANVADEVEQFRQLQKACRESEYLAAALRDVGLGDVAAMDPRRVDPETGRLVQAFNRMVEDRWR